MSNVIITPTFSHQGVSCTGNTMAFTIAVNPTAQVNQPDDQVYCNGSATPLINFTTLNSGGVSTYDWTINNSNIGYNKYNNPVFSPIRINSNLNTFHSNMNEYEQKSNVRRNNYNKSQIYSSSDSLFSQENQSNILF